MQNQQVHPILRDVLSKCLGAYVQARKVVEVEPNWGAI